MKPVFRLVANGRGITALINELPSRGAHIEVYLGYEGQALARLGRYTVDEVELSGPTDSLVIRGKASDMRGSGKTTRSGSREEVPLQQIVRDLAARNGWQPMCPVATKVPRVDQFNESDFNFITRLAKQYDCTAKVGDGKLLVMPRQGGQSASGKALGTVTITRGLNTLADQGDFETITRRINGGLNGLEDRLRLYARAVVKALDRRLARERRLKTQNTTHYQELIDEQTKQSRLRDQLATADVQLSVLLAASTERPCCRTSLPRVT
ncbi:hypothetical protein [Pseudomonas sp. GZD-222]|uniref:hypothetical protein n=1 Tax=Pseudomonas sp. GZD-222 TaxID=3404805 RepID=UPI003BB79C45